MGLHYPNTITNVVFGSKSGTTRTSVALTNAYQTEESTNPTKSFSTEGYSKLNVDLLYTTGAAETNNSIELRVEGSTDNVNFYRLPNESVSDGTSTLTQREFTFVGASAGTAYTISIGLDIFYKYMRLAAKETGVGANAGTVYGEITLLGL
jgi:hypothetical protein